jgi:hypothetical protein
MSMMKKIYIGLFAVLYLAVAAVSTIHAIDFFGLANNSWMSVILAISFELGQAAVLFSLLTSGKERGKIMPWVLMSIFTLVQVLGNVYSSYKYILLHSPENLKFFKEPIFIWTQLPDDQATVIVTYIVGAILPVCALLLTSMVTNQLESNEPNNEVKEIQNDQYNKEEKLEETTQQPIIENEEIKPEIETVIEEIPTETTKEIEIPTIIESDVEDVFNGNINITNKSTTPSHFINL